jgi:hypothetical protein
MFSLSSNQSTSRTIFHQKLHIPHHSFRIKHFRTRISILSNSNHHPEEQFLMLHVQEAKNLPLAGMLTKEMMDLKPDVYCKKYINTGTIVRISIILLIISRMVL